MIPHSWLRIVAISVATVLLVIACASSSTSPSAKADDGTDSRFTVMLDVGSSVLNVVEDHEKHNTCYYVMFEGGGVSCLPDIGYGR